MNPFIQKISTVLLFAAFVSGCSNESASSGDSNTDSSSGSQEVVIYTALDREFSEPILKKFEEDSGITVKPVYDTEAVKTVGLVNRLITERDRPTADIFWNNEILRSLQLKKEGITQSYDVEAAATLPAEMQGPDGHWNGFASRARVILVNTELIPNREDYPTSVHDLTDPKWAGQAGFAKPLFGTTSTHAAILWVLWGPDKAKEFWENTMENAVMYAGNAQARDAVADGEIAWCFTDTDDAFGAIQDGKPVEIIYPDGGADDMGVILLPNTLIKIKDGPNSQAADELLNYLLSEDTEVALSNSRSAQIPVRASLSPPDGIPSLEGKKLLDIDWQDVVDALPECQVFLTELVQ